jgi:hypothetical protein
MFKISLASMMHEKWTQHFKGKSRASWVLWIVRHKWEYKGKIQHDCLKWTESADSNLQCWSSFAAVIPRNTRSHVTHQLPPIYHTSFFLLNELTPWSRVLLEKLRVRSASQEIPRILWNPKVHITAWKFSLCITFQLLFIKYELLLTLFQMYLYFTFISSLILILTSSSQSFWVSHSFREDIPSLYYQFQ